MSIPSTGTTWKASGLATIDNRFYARGGHAAVLMRDNRGLATNISPYQAGSPPTPFWSPLALDGTLRDDLLAWILVDGVWQVNPNDNEGWYLVGALDEKGGPDRKPNIKHDDAMVLQSTFPFDTDLIGEGLTIQFTPVEVLKPLIKRLRLNLPLSDSSGNSIVELPGSTFSISKPVDADSVDRQIMLVFERTKGGRTIYEIEAYSLLKLTDIGSSKRDKTAPDAGPLTYTVLPDPFLMDRDPTDPTSEDLVPALFSEFVGGDGWTAIGGAPIFPGLAPVATPLTATTAEVEFQAAVGGGDSVTYTVEKSVSPYSSWTSATVASVHADTPVEGAVTLDLSSLATATTYKFRVTATGTNTLATTSANSNTCTQP
jgi:hypothetical protein